ncbi:MAG TPA: carboxypeptidase regulatory-like domain-containing protein [Kofleriaceae bacterium]|nr:carboxypeptidase regulatory-like domain-containing protein [Kofleriaceae bacterium]
MKQASRLAALAAVIVVVVVAALVTRHLGWWGRHAAREQAAARGPAPALPARPAAKEAHPQPPSERPQLVRDDDPRGTLRLEGLLLDGDDHPVGGARVAIDSAPERTITAGSDGAFAFDGLIARDYRLEASAGDLHGGPVRLRLAPDTGLVTLRMVPAGTVEVTVREADGGAPVANAEVELRGTLTWTATTGADGVATLHGVGPTWGPLAASAAGFAPARTMVSTAGDPKVPARFELTLARGAAVSGRVVDEAGAAVAGARVVATSASEPFPVVDVRRDGVATGADGSFTFPAVAAGTYRLDARDARHAPASSPPFLVDGTHPRTGLTVVLGAGGVVRGTVKTPDGAPVAGADVSVVTRGGIFWRPRRQAFTGADGRYVIEGLPRRELDVVAWHPDGASAIAAVDLAAEPERQLDLVLDVRGAIDGLVVDGAGEPIGDAQVLAEPVWNGGTADQQAWSIRGVQQTLTDPGGRFHLAGLPDGDYRIRAARQGADEDALWTARATTTRPGAPPLRIVLSADGTITGKVAFADGHAPAAVTIAVDGAGGRPSARTDGSFAIDTAAGEHVLIVSGPGFSSKAVRGVKVEEGQATDVGTVTVEAGRSISGRVVDGSGAPVEGATVAAGSNMSGGGRELFIEDESPGARSTETDADGRFTLTGFDQRALAIVAGKDGVGRSPSVQVPHCADSVSIELTLAPVGSLAGTVTRGGQPLGDTVVIAKPAAAISSNFFVVTGADGSFAFDALTPGSYLVSPMIGGGGPRPKDIFTRRVEVTAGARASVTIDTTPGPATLTVDVVTDAGPPVALAQVIVIQAKVDAQSLAMLRDGSLLPPDLNGATLAFYMRAAMGGPVTVEGMQPDAYTACAVPLPVKSPAEAQGMMDQVDSLPMKCEPVTVTAAPTHVTLTVPAAWATPKG